MHEVLAESEAETRRQPGRRCRRLGPLALHRPERQAGLRPLPGLELEDERDLGRIVAQVEPGGAQIREWHHRPAAGDTAHRRQRFGIEPLRQKLEQPAALHLHPLGEIDRRGDIAEIGAIHAERQGQKVARLGDRRLPPAPGCPGGQGLPSGRGQHGRAMGGDQKSRQDPPHGRHVAAQEPPGA